MSASNTSNALSVTMWRLVTFIGHVVDSTIDNLEGVIMHTCVIASVISYICLHFLNNAEEYNLDATWCSYIPVFIRTLYLSCFVALGVIIDDGLMGFIA